MSLAPIVPTICNAGLAAVFRAQGDGLKAQISHIATGRGDANGASWRGYTVDRSMTALKHEDARTPLLQGSLLNGEGFRVIVEVPPAPAATQIPIFEVGVVLTTGEMLAIWSLPVDYPLTSRTPSNINELAFELHLAQVPLDALTIVVAQPDIPDTTGVLAQLLALDARITTGTILGLTRTLKAEWAL